MRVVLLSVGKDKPCEESALRMRYSARVDSMGKRVGIILEHIALPQSVAKRPEERIEEEGQSIARTLRLQRLQPLWMIAFDANGDPSWTSERFRTLLMEAKEGFKTALVCVVGGPDGLSDRVIREASHVLSFGAMTLPHQLVHVLIMEQIYRVTTMQIKHPYHRQ